MTSIELSLAAGVLLSLLATYLPGFNTWYAKLTKEQKQLGMMLALLITSAGVLGLSCLPDFNLLGSAVTCDRAGLASVIKVFVLALIANQGTDRITPEPKSVKGAKAQAS